MPASKASRSRWARVISRAVRAFSPWFLSKMRMGMATLAPMVLKSNGLLNDGFREYQPPTVGSAVPLAIARRLSARAFSMAGFGEGKNGRVAHAPRRLPRDRKEEPFVSQMPP